MKVKLPFKVTNFNSFSNDSVLAPKDFLLYQNYPDHFNPTTEINYSIPGESLVTLRIYNLIGQLITGLVNGEQNAGEYSVSFDGSNLPLGIYLDVFQARSLISNKSVNLVWKMILVNKTQILLINTDGICEI